ncbi:hypothetical protein NHP194003_00300 [Helicobacter suis]|uniref:Uncharacterized protein n=2 Tax=Helicobacter suis TaxID=104628 RepID=A0ABM7KX10_9HELI|nr:hypothetical protein NHP190020_00310 [Helicobacter suis]BCD46826.1 hypothetical protein NHP194003_00300 [Helicobacter suis]
MIQEVKNAKKRMEWFEKTLQDTLSPYKNHSVIAPILSQESSQEVVEYFLQAFFLNRADIPLHCFFSNLSLEDKLAQDIEDEEKNITLGVRIPNHPIFSKVLPKGMSLLVRRFLPYGASSPVFYPNEVSLTSSDANAYEQELEVACIKIESGERQRIANNLVNPAWIQQLPKFGIETSKRLAEWMDYLKFEEEYIEFHTRQKFLVFNEDFYEKQRNRETELKCVLVIEADSYRKQLEYIRSYLSFRGADCEIVPLDASLHPVDFEPNPDFKNNKDKNNKDKKPENYRFLGYHEVRNQNLIEKYAEWLRGYLSDLSQKKQKKQQVEDTDLLKLLIINFLKSK